MVRKLATGDVDLGIVGRDMFEEISNGDPDLIIVHDALRFGACHLGLGVPMTGAFASVNTLEQLRDMPQWTESNPLRVVTGRDFMNAVLGVETRSRDSARTVPGQPSLFSQSRGTELLKAKVWLASMFFVWVFLR